MIFFRPARLVLAALLVAVGLTVRVNAQTTSFTVSQLVLINTTTQQALRALTSTSTIDFSVDGKALNVRADVTGTVGSVAFILDGVLIQTENYAPFAMKGDKDGVFISWTPSLGSHVLRAIPYQYADRKGTAGAAHEVRFNVVTSASTAQLAGSATFGISTLSLINTTTQKVLRTLTTGGTINLATDGSALNVRADVSGTVGSVDFVLNGQSVHAENYAPFALAGDTDGVFLKWTPALGTHTLRVVPYQYKDRKGSIGTVTEVKFSVVNAAPTTTTPPPSTTPPPTTTVPDVIVPPPPTTPVTTQSALYKSDGTMDLSMYSLLALSYDKATMEARLGPSFLDLSPTATDDRPTLFQPTSKPRTSGYIRTNPYELGGPPVTDGDYWSDSGQVGYVPDDITDAGLDRVQTYAYYDRVFAISPRLDWASGKPHSEPQTREPTYATMFGELPKHPIAMVRNYGMQQNEALVLFKEGYLAIAGTQTSRGATERPYPGLIFPTNKVPTALAITTSNEFALVTIWDTTTKKGQLAVIALEGKYLAFHTWPYMGLPNQGSWSAFKLLGYIDLPMATPTSVAASSNGWWSGPSQTGGLVMSQIKLDNETHRKNVYGGAWDGVVAKGGYAIVASQHDNKVAIVDLSPLFTYMRESYLSSASSYAATMATRGAGPSDFPQAFSIRPSITPKIVFQADVPTPTTVLAGLKLDRWSKDHFKGYVASRDGTIRIYDTSSVMKRYDWERLGGLREVGSFNVGRNPVSMCFTRRGDSNLPLLPISSDGTQARPDGLNNLFYIAVRGDRKVVTAVTFNGAGVVYRTIKDKRMGDPVAVSTAVRGPIVSVTDFRGRKMLSFRVGRINDGRNNVIYGCGEDGTAPFELAGSVPFGGYPFLVNSTNVN
jgi:hypothetical protein